MKKKKEKGLERGRLDSCEEARLLESRSSREQDLPLVLWEQRSYRCFAYI